MSDTAMTWREKVVVRILLTVAGMIATDFTVKRDVQNLASHISYGDKP